jgi:hypothetical protein
VAVLPDPFAAVVRTRPDATVLLRVEQVIVGLRIPFENVPLQGEPCFLPAERATVPPLPKTVSSLSPSLMCLNCTRASSERLRAKSNKEEHPAAVAEPGLGVDQPANLGGLVQVVVALTGPLRFSAAVGSRSTALRGR